jgi:MFS-type transporter involved in bile tolerance (Atg22 family)
MTPNATVSVGTGLMRELDEPHQSAEEPRRIPRRAVGSWVLYDLANTIFSMGVVSMYGLYGMVGRFSAVTGPLLWGGVSWLAVSMFGLPPHVGQGIAVLTLLVLIVISYVILQPVSDVPPDWTRHADRA